MVCKKGEAEVMTWLGLAILAAIMLTLVNFGDKYVLEARIPDARAVLVYIGIIDGSAGILLWLLAGMTFFPMEQGIMLLFAGMTIATANLFYFRAIAIEETSRVIVWVQLTPIPTLFMSILFFGEILTAQQFMGFTLILFSAMAVARGRGRNWRDLFKLSPAFWLVVLATFMWATETIIIDQSLAFSMGDSESASLAMMARTMAYTSVGHTMGVFLMMLLNRQVRESFLHYWRQRSVRQVMPIVWLESIFIGRQFVYYAALSLGPVALVSVVSSTQVLWGIVFGWVLTVFLPSIFKEDITRHVLMEKGALGALMFAGIVLVG